MGLQAKTAIVVRDGIEKEIPLEEVVEADIVYIQHPLWLVQEELRSTGFSLKAGSTLRGLIK